MESRFSVVVEGGKPWGFTLQGGLEFRAPLRVGKVTPGGKAERAGLTSGDYIISINDTAVKGLKHLQAKQLIINSPSTLQLSCTKAAPVGLFSPSGNKPAPQFSFASPRSPSPSSLPTTGRRSRSSSFTSPAITHPSFTSPSHSREPSLTSSPFSLGGSGGKSASLKRPPPPAAPVAHNGGGRKRSGTLPSNIRPRPPVTYQGDVGYSSSGVSSSVSSTASSPPPHVEEGSHHYSPSHRPHHTPAQHSPSPHHPHPPPPQNLAQYTPPQNLANGDGVGVNSGQDQTVELSRVTINDSTVDTVNTATDTVDAVIAEPVGNGDSTNMIPDSSDATTALTGTANTTSSQAVSDVDAKHSPVDAADAAIDSYDTINTATDSNDTTNMPADSNDTTSTVTGIADSGDTPKADVLNTTGSVDTTHTSNDQSNTMNTISDTADTSNDQSDTMNTISDTADTSNDQSDTMNTISDPADTASDPATTEDSTELEESVKVEAENTAEAEEKGREGKEEGVTVVEGDRNGLGEVTEDVGVKEVQSLPLVAAEQPALEATPSEQEPEQTERGSIDQQIEDARKAREAEMKARAHSLLTGKLGSLVRSKPPLPPSASVAKPPLPPSASSVKPARPISAPVTRSPHRTPLPPTAPLGANQRAPQRTPLSPTAPPGANQRTPQQSSGGSAPVIKPYLVKKGEGKPIPQASSVPDRTMSDIKMAHRMQGWYKDMFQGFQQTVEELFPEPSASDSSQHVRTKSTPADVDTYVYDHRGLKVRKSSFSSSSPVSPVHTRTHSAHTSSEGPDPVYVYDHRGLRVKKESLPSSETAERETTPTIVLDVGEEVTTADVLASSRRQYSMDSGYDERGLRLRADSQGNGDTDQEEATTITGGEETRGVDVSKDDVIDTIKKPTAYKSDKFTTEPSRTYWSAIDQQFSEDQRKKREAQDQQEEGETRSAQGTATSSTQSSPHHKMAHMHPLLTEGLEDVPARPGASDGSGEVFDRINPQKLAGALDNAKTLGTMEQEGVPSNMLPLQAQQREKSQEPEKLPPPGKKGRALFAFEGQSEKELSFQKSAIIDLLHTVNENWLEGMIGQRKGIFPSSYIQVLSHEELREVLSRENAPLMQVRATYDFNSHSDKELQFKKGDMIAVTKKIDDNWYQGYLGDKKGIFPTSYVELLEDIH